MAVLGFWWVGCVSADAPPDVPARDLDAFRCEAYPVLLRDCGFASCHGNEDRLFQVFGPGRKRLNAETGLACAPEPAELERSYSRALSFLRPSAPFDESLLLRKPLARGAGGAGHMGVDVLGRDVYVESAASGYQALLRWANGMALGGCDPATNCQEPSP